MMRLTCITLLIAAAIGLHSVSSHAETSLSLADKVSLQAAMQTHVDRLTVDGTVLYLDQEKGEVRRLHPVTAHPMILAFGEHFVLCFDFRDDAGNTVPIDYYMARQEASYVVFHTAVADRSLLSKLMSNGRVTRLK